jgi:hypothetical protein
MNRCVKNKHIPTIIEKFLHFVIKIRVEQIIKIKICNSGLFKIPESIKLLKNKKKRQAIENSERDNLFKINDLILIYF